MERAHHGVLQLRPRSRRQRHRRPRRRPRPAREVRVGPRRLLRGRLAGRLPPDAARSALTAHVDHLLRQADEYAARDYGRAADDYRTAYSHAFGIGQTLAATLLPPDQAAKLDQPSWRLRSELDRLLGEHIALAVATLRAGATESPDFPAAAASLDKNTDELTAAMGTLFGPAAGQQFMPLWADHIDALVGYTTAVAGNDGAGRQAALDKLRGFEGKLAAFLDTATGSRIPSADLASAFLHHDQMLTQQVDAMANKDYAKAHELAYGAYQDMFGLAKQLSVAFGETVAARLPAGWRRDRCGRHGSAMRWRAVACVALGATAVVCSASSRPPPRPRRRAAPPPACRRRSRRSTRCAATPTWPSRCACASRRSGSTRR